MTPQRADAQAITDSNPERLSPWWWLGLPLGAALGLLGAGHLAPDFYAGWIANEQSGLLELSHVILPLGGLLIGLRMLAMASLRRRPLLWIWIALGSLACLYIAGEEASWGQHYFGWPTPESWRAVNDQGETNLHNISSWLDQKPRLLLEFGVILGGIAVPLLALCFPGLRRPAWAVVLPPLACLPSALLAEGSRMAERLLDLVGGQGYLFYRASEVQEFYFYLFILLYLVVLRRRLEAGPREAK
ncbi:MAG: hypothetical protein OEM59_22530 [Rhodospirillales bacterium]|nr:hypothetical protein [Rhodospirillales bacterium]